MLLGASLAGGDLLTDCATHRPQGSSKRRRSGELRGCSGRLSSSPQQHGRGCWQTLKAVATARRCPEEPEPSDSPAAVSDKQRFLLRYAQEVTPDIISLFEEQSPEYIAEAMRSTISQLLGNLPEEFFDVTVSPSRTEDLAQLCYSVIMTGYLFRNCQQRLELQAQLGDLAEREALAVEVLSACKSESYYAEGSRKDQVAGHVVRWHNHAGLQSIPAQDYIAKLEREVASLRRQVARDLYLHARSNPLLSYLQGLEASQLATLTGTAQEDTYEAVNSVVHSVMRASRPEQGAQQHAVRAGELASLLYWLAIVGYHLRTLEARWDLEQSLMLPT